MNAELCHRHGCPTPPPTFTRVGAFWVIRCPGCGAAAIRPATETRPA